MRLWTTPGRGVELHGEDLRIRRTTSRGTSPSSTATHRNPGRRPHPSCTTIPAADLRRRRLSTDHTAPTTTPYLYTGRSTVKLHPTPALWNTSRHGRIHPPRHRHPTPEP